MILLLGCIAQPPLVLDTQKGIDTADSADTALTRDTTPPDTTVETIIGDTNEDTPDDDPPDLVVDCNGGGDFRTISAAMEAAPSGARIGIKACTYAESINYNGKTLDVYGLDARGDVILTGDGTNPVVTAIRGESLGTRLAHLTLTDGGAEYGAGLYVANAVMRVEDVEMTGLRRSYAVVYQSAATLELIDVSIHDNEGRREAYVILADNGSLTAQRLSLTCEDFTYGIYEHVVMLLLDSTVDCRAGNYAVVVGGGELHSRRSTILANDIGVYGADNDDTRNERLWLFNTLVTGETYAAYVTFMHVKARNSLFWGGDYGLMLDHAHVESYVYASAAKGRTCGFWGEGFAYPEGWNASEDPFCAFGTTDAVTADPQFADAPDDFHLLTGSPLIDAGDPDPDYNDDDDTRNDIGLYGGPEADGPR